MKKTIKRLLVPSLLSFALFLPFTTSLAYADEGSAEEIGQRPFSSVPTADDLAQIDALMKEEANGTLLKTSVNSDMKFNFKDQDTGVTDWSMKHNDTSYYVNCWKKEVNYCNLYADGYWAGSVRQCTYKGAARLNGLGEFQIYNSVWEQHAAEMGAGPCPARLGGWRAGSSWWGTGYVEGQYSPDVILYWNYPVLNP